MKIAHILGKLIALTKEIEIHAPVKNAKLSTEFFAYPPHSLPVGGVGLTWWFTHKSIKVCEDIAIMAMAYDPVLRNGDREAFALKIRETIQKNARNEELFDFFGKILNPEIKTLFEARNKEDVKIFSQNLWAIIHEELVNSLTNWLVLYPLAGVIAQSFDLMFDGIFLLQADDNTTWKQFVQNYPCLKHWNPITGRNKEGSSVVVSENPPATWLLCEIKGTQQGAKKRANYLMRKFIGVLFAHLREQDKHIIRKSRSSSNMYSIQFPMDEWQIGIGQSVSKIGDIFPFLSEDIPLCSSLYSNMTNWYQKCEGSPPDIADRARKGAHFIQYAVMADELERFIHFFIALDALFGVRGDVERTIKEGVIKILPHDKWEQRTEKLFNLRSELVHGGISFIEEWKNLEQYYRCFNSDPLDDIEFIAMTTLRKYFD